MTATLLVARAARIAVDDVVAIPELTLETRGNRLVVAGHASPLLCALTGIAEGVGAAAQDAAVLGEITRTPGAARATSGELQLAGHDVVTRAHLAVVGAAPLDPPLPPDWTVEAYVLETARLGLVAREGRVSRLEIMRRATDALARLGLAGARKKPIKSLHPAERRVLVLASAVASGPSVLVADRPLSGLEGQSAMFVHGALEAAASDRPAVISVAQVAPGTAEGSFARTATDLAAIVSGELSLFGAPAEVLAAGRVYRITIRTNADALRAALEADGAKLSGGPTHFSMRLAEGQDASRVLRLASEVRSAVMDLVPIL
ncbi:MAG: ABC transporter ATP-binding protein [Polyangiaceae bacterium]|nr:ABC transporter ATP-binding protein [Polyangiaceae bacterium]MBK8943115.1 ABC transporter ATP-binding protein [Polyangiaceae bacterium]